MSGAFDDAPRWLTEAAARAEPHFAAAPTAWLFHDRGSLTERLTALAAGRFAVAVHAEGWQRLRADECQALDLPGDSSGWIREVWLEGAGDRWVFARSVASRAALAASGCDLANLGTQPLGHLLFQTPAFVRGPLEATRLPAAALPAGAAIAPCWTRRSRFQRDALGILVAETFLPAFDRHLR